MALTPMDIYNKEFNKSFRGYDQEEVDMFLDQVVDEYEKLQKANIIAEEKIASLTEHLEHYRTLEGTLKETLMTAQNTAEEVLENARKKAAMIVDSAQRQARDVVEKASREIGQIQGMDLEVRKAATMFKSRFVALLEAQLEFFRQETAEIEAERRKAPEAPIPAEPVQAEPPQVTEPVPPRVEPIPPRVEPMPPPAPVEPPIQPRAEPVPPPVPEPYRPQAPAEPMEELYGAPLSGAEEDIADDADALIREIQHYSALRDDDMETVSDEGFVIGSDD